MRKITVASVMALLFIVVACSSSSDDATLKQFIYEADSVAESRGVTISVNEVIFTPAFDVSADLGGGSVAGAKGEATIRADGFLINTNPAPVRVYYTPDSPQLKISNSPFTDGIFQIAGTDSVAQSDSQGRFFQVVRANQRVPYFLRINKSMDRSGETVAIRFPAIGFADDPNTWSVETPDFDLPEAGERDFDPLPTAG